MYVYTVLPGSLTSAANPGLFFYEAPHSVTLAEAEGRSPRHSRRGQSYRLRRDAWVRGESRVAVPRSGSAMGVGDGKLHGGYAATLDSRASSRMTGWGGFGLGLSQFSCGKCCRRGGFKAHCAFASRKPQCGWIPPIAWNDGGLFTVVLGVSRFRYISGRF